MTSFFRKLRWLIRRPAKDAELREEFQFHLEEEADQRQGEGLTEQEARWAARRELGNLGIGANTAIYSFMDAILLRSLPVPDPASLVVVKWRSKPFAYGSRAVNGSEFVLHSIDGDFFPDSAGMTGTIFPFPAFERLQQASEPVLSSLFGYFEAGDLNVMVKGASELAAGEYVTGDFFQGLAVSPAAGRLLIPDDDRAGAPPVAVISMGYSQRRFGGPANATGQLLLINNVAFTVVGVAPSEFFGVDPGAAPHVYLPMHASLLLDPDAASRFLDPNYYWLEMMGRLRPGISLAQAETALTALFAQWVTPTATNDRERANLPVLRLSEGAGGLDTLRRQYSKPLYVLWAMVGLILAIACANTANLLLARASARRREIAVRLSIGAGRLRLVRQLLTESLLLASLGGALGILIAVAGIRVLTRLLANGQEGFTLHAELNWHVLAVTLGLSLLCGLLFGLAPAMQAARPAVMPTLKDTSPTERRGFARHGFPRPSATQALVVAQITISLLLLVAAGLFVRSLANLQSIPLGFSRDHVLLFEVNAPQAGYPEANAAAFYAGLRRRLSEIPGVRHATLSHASLIRAGRGHPVTVNGVPARGHRILQTGPGFFTTMQIPILRGREIEDRDRQGTLPVAVVSDLFARTYFGEENPLGQRITVGGSSPLEPEIIGVAATARYGGLKNSIPPVVYLSYAQVPSSQLQKMTFAVRTDGDPLRYVGAVRQIVREADARVPVTNVKTQAADIDQTINQEIVFARLCSAFAILALVIACVGLYGTMACTVARRTREIGIRMALGARRGIVIWMVLREVCVLAALGLAIGVPIARVTSRLIESFLFDMKPNDPRALAVAVVILLSAALVASYGPARRAARVDPMIALRHE
jgi:macrolide transport system ATP-binding/permease protein